MKSKILTVALAALTLLMVSTPALAQDHAAGASLGGGLGVGLAMGLAALGCGMGQGRAAAAALEGVESDLAGAAGVDELPWLSFLAAALYPSLR